MNFIKTIAYSFICFSMTSPAGAQPPAGNAKIVFEISQVNRRQYDLKTLEPGQPFFLNRDYQVITVPEAFKKLQFVSSWGGNADHGVIIPSSAGTVYVAGPKGGLPGWEAVPASDITYMTKSLTYASVYKREAKAGERIEIASNEKSFIGISPIAAEITIRTVPSAKEARLREIRVDGKTIPAFKPEDSTLVYYLPHSYKKIPTVEPAGIHTSCRVEMLQQAVDVRGNEKERTTVVKVTSQDGSRSVTYKVQFQVVPPMDIFICIGQSNMAGYSPLDAQKGDLEPLQNCFLLNDQGGFETFVNPLNRYSNVRGNIYGQLGLTYAFAAAVAKHAGRPIGFVVNAKGGSSVNSWLKGADDGFYEKTLERVAEAKKWGEVKAVLWHQGERDRMEYKKYPEKLKKLVSDLRKDIGNNELFFVAGQIGQWMPASSDFNAMISNISEMIPSTACAGSEGLKNADNAHFDRRSALTLGERYAEKVLNAIYKKKQ